MVMDAAKAKKFVEDTMAAWGVTPEEHDKENGYVTKVRTYMANQMVAHQEYTDAVAALRGAEPAKVLRATAEHLTKARLVYGVLQVYGAYPSQFHTQFFSLSAARMMSTPEAARWYLAAAKLADARPVFSLPETIEQKAELTAVMAALRYEDQPLASMADKVPMAPRQSRCPSPATVQRALTLAQEQTRPSTPVASAATAAPHEEAPPQSRQQQPQFTTRTEVSVAAVTKELAPMAQVLARLGARLAEYEHRPQQAGQQVAQTGTVELDGGRVKTVVTSRPTLAMTLAQQQRALDFHLLQKGDEPGHVNYALECARENMLTDWIVNVKDYFEPSANGRLPEAFFADPLRRTRLTLQMYAADPTRRETETTVAVREFLITASVAVLYTWDRTTAEAFRTQQAGKMDDPHGAFKDTALPKAKAAHSKRERESRGGYTGGQGRRPN